MQRIQSFLQQVAMLSTLLLPACLGAPLPAPAPTPPSTPAGIWLRPIAAANDSTTIEGLHLLPDGRLHLVGIYSMDGLTWSARTDSLTLTTATERYPEADPLNYHIEKLDADSLVLAAPGYLGGRYRRSDSLPNTPLPRSSAAALYANRAAYRPLSDHLRLLRARIAAHLGQDQFIRGYLRMGHEVRSFIPCGGERDYWVDDLTGSDLYEVYRSLVLAPPADYPPLYVELDALVQAPRSEGFAADYDSLLVAIELRFAAGETRGCADDLDSVYFRAQGNEPFWNLAIHTEGIRVQQMGYEALYFPVDLKKHHLAQEAAENVQIYRAAIDTTHALMLHLEHQPCRDSMAGNYYHFTAKLEWDGRLLRGCARQGTLPYK
jgi:uncharacterized membrane protein